MAELKYFREGLLEPAVEGAANADGAFRLSFASELPIFRHDKKYGRYNEILSHGPGDVNLNVLNTQGVVLRNHDEREQVGEVVKGSAKVRADKKTEAQITVSDNALREDVNLKRTSGVSVGYTRLSLLREEAAGADGVRNLVFSWQPYEISILQNTQPADDTVGFGRSKRKKGGVARMCPDCEGDGECDSCDGEGTDEDTDDGRCEDCGGTKRCRSCSGNGYFKSARSKVYRIPSLDDIARLTNEEKQRMRLLFAPTTPDGGTITITESEAAVKLAREKSATDTASAERARVKDINLASTEFETKHGRKNKGKLAETIRQMRDEAIEKGHTPAEFNSRALQTVVNAEPEVQDVREFVDESTLSQFSIVRAIQGAVEASKPGDLQGPKKDTLEGDVITAYRQKCKESGWFPKEPDGFIIPAHAQYGCVGMTRAEMAAEGRKFRNKYGNFRDQQATVFGAGGAVVPTYWLLPVIELLRNKSVLNRVGIRSMAGLTGNVIIPRQEAPTTAYSVAEIAAVTASQLTLGQITMTPHRVSSQVAYSKQLVFQSSPDFESLLNYDMMTVLALKKDELGLNGQGAASEPLGILNTPGIGTVTFGATPTYIKLISFMTAIRTLNVRGPLAYVSTSATKGSLMGVAEALTGATTIGGSQNAIWKRGIGGTGEEDGEVVGCQAVDSQQIPFNLMLCGMFMDFIEGIFGGFDTVVDPYTKAANAEIVVTMNLWLDYVMRHVQSFVASTDAGNQ